MSSVSFGVTSRTFEYSHTVGRRLFSGSGFRHPMDLALSQDDLIYVANRSTQQAPEGVRITVCTAGEEFITEFSEFGEDAGKMIGPVSIALDGNDNVYVADQWLNRISIFDKHGIFLDSWGREGSGPGEMDQPFGIAFDKNYDLYVVDSRNHRIQKFTKDGKFLDEWGGLGNKPGQFNLPWGICLDTQGDIYVADWRNDRIQKFKYSGEYLGEFGSSGNGTGQYLRPAGVAVDKHGDIYVADWGNHRVQVFTRHGRHITTLTGDATLSKWGALSLNANPDMAKQRSLVRDFEPERQFWNPVAVRIDPQGRVLVADCMQHRIQVYQKGNY